MIYKKKNKDSYREPIPGVKYKTLVHGKNTNLGEFFLDKGAVVPMHEHYHEQTGYLVSGKMKFTIGDESFIAEPGASWNIPSHIEHGVEVLEDTLVIEVFSPVREDYL